MELILDDLIKILLAIVVGGIIGIERELHYKVAGIRTLIFICVGSTLFTLLSTKLAGDSGRITANIINGVGFLGAGVIMHEGGHVTGLTTAATIWLVSALGIGLGGGDIKLVLVVTVITLIVLSSFPILERWVCNFRGEEYTYELVFAFNQDKYKNLEKFFSESQLKIVKQQQSKENGCLRCSWQLTGSTSNHERLIQQLLLDPEIDEFRYTTLVLN